MSTSTTFKAVIVRKGIFQIVAGGYDTGTGYTHKFEKVDDNTFRFVTDEPDVSGDALTPFVNYCFVGTESMPKSVNVVDGAGTHQVHVRGIDIEKELGAKGDTVGNG